jgi:hypothetical protein
VSRAAKDLVLALSFSNVLFLKGWMELVEGVRHPYYRADGRHYWTDCAALMLDVALLALVFWVAVSAARRYRGGIAWPLARGTFLAFFVFWLVLFYNVLRTQVPMLSLASLAGLLGRVPLSLLLLALLAGGAVVFRRLRLSPVRLAAGAVLVLSPFVPLTFANAIRVGATPSSGAGPKSNSPPPALRGQPGPRVVWLVFDSLDFQLAMGERPSGLALPELDRLLSESLSATQARSPAPVTGRCLPALLTGRHVRRALPHGRDDLALTFQDTGEVGLWSRQPSLFSRARAAGRSTALIGWFHPYCRVLGHVTTRCAWRPFRAEGEALSLRGPMTELVSQILPPALRFSWPAWLTADEARASRAAHIEAYQELLAEARTAVADPSIDLVFVHWPVPHWPYIYDRESEAFVFEPDARASYLDNLVLADHTLGELRRDLERAGSWDTTAVLVTSDHAWPEASSITGRHDPRVPFILKLPGQQTPLEHDQPLDTVVAASLLEQIQSGEISTPDSAARWLRAHASRVGT